MSETYITKLRDLREALDAAEAQAENCQEALAAANADAEALAEALRDERRNHELRWGANEALAAHDERVKG